MWFGVVPLLGVWFGGGSQCDSGADRILLSWPMHLKLPTTTWMGTGYPKTLALNLLG